MWQFKYANTRWTVLCTSNGLILLWFYRWYSPLSVHNRSIMSHITWNLLQSIRILQILYNYYLLIIRWLNISQIIYNICKLYLRIFSEQIKKRICAFLQSTVEVQRIFNWVKTVLYETSNLNKLPFCMDCSHFCKQQHLECVNIPENVTTWCKYGSENYKNTIAS